MAGKSTKGICYFCGKSITKAGAKKHLLTHECTVGDKQACMLVKVESPYLKEYWLYADIPLRHRRAAMLLECQGDGSLDNFLFIVYSVPGVNNHAEKSQNAE